MVEIQVFIKAGPFGCLLLSLKLKREDHQGVQQGLTQVHGVDPQELRKLPNAVGFMRAGPSARQLRLRRADQTSEGECAAQPGR